MNTDYLIYNNKSNQHGPSTFEPMENVTAIADQRQQIGVISQPLSKIQFQDQFNKLRERLFRQLSKVPIQVESLNNTNQQCCKQQQQQKSSSLSSSSSFSSSSISSGSNGVGFSPSVNCTSNLVSGRCNNSSNVQHKSSYEFNEWRPLLIKYYQEQAASDILNLHYGCALMSHNFKFGLAPNEDFSAYIESLLRSPIETYHGIQGDKGAIKPAKSNYGTLTEVPVQRSTINQIDLQNDQSYQINQDYMSICYNNQKSFSPLNGQNCCTLGCCQNNNHYVQQQQNYNLALNDQASYNNNCNDTAILHQQQQSCQLQQLPSSSSIGGSSTQSSSSLDGLSHMRSQRGSDDSSQHNMLQNLKSDVPSRNKLDTTDPKFIFKPKQHPQQYRDEQIFDPSPNWVRRTGGIEINHQLMRDNETNNQAGLIRVVDNSTLPVNIDSLRDSVDPFMMTNRCSSNSSKYSNISKINTIDENKTTSIQINDNHLSTLHRVSYKDEAFTTGNASGPASGSDMFLLDNCTNNLNHSIQLPQDIQLNHHGLLMTSQQNSSICYESVVDCQESELHNNNQQKTTTDPLIVEANSNPSSGPITPATTILSHPPLQINAIKDNVYYNCSPSLANNTQFIMSSPCNENLKLSDNAHHQHQQPPHNYQQHFASQQDHCLMLTYDTLDQTEYRSKMGPQVDRSSIRVDDIAIKTNHLVYGESRTQNQDLSDWIQMDTSTNMIDQQPQQEQHRHQQQQENYRAITEQQSNNCTYESNRHQFYLATN